MLNQTTKNDLITRGHSDEEIENSLLFPIWQDYMDEDRTFYSVTETAISEE